MTENHLRPGDLVVVTGAAQGIGRAIAQRLARDGARLALWDIKADGLAETAALCGDAATTTAIVDTGEAASIAAAAGGLAAAGGRPFALVNNAGIYPRATVAEADAELWRRVLSVNLIGYFLCAKALLPAMVAEGRGAIVNISSSTALRGAAGGAHYAASKAGIMGFTKSLALEVAPTVRVNCVAPGVAETAQPLSYQSLEDVRARGRQTPLGRVGQPEDTAGVVAFLLGPDAAYMTGQTIAVSGGATMVP